MFIRDVKQYTFKNYNIDVSFAWSIISLALMLNCRALHSIETSNTAAL